MTVCRPQPCCDIKDADRKCPEDPELCEPDSAPPSWPRLTQKPEAEFYLVLGTEPVQSAHLCGVPAEERGGGRAGLSCLLSASLRVESMHHEVSSLGEVL